MQTLRVNTTLQSGKYTIISVLGQGGFGITYLAVQNGLERNVAIKEFFMKELCERYESTSRVTLGATGSRETVNRFREKFLKEARNIAKLNHPNIVRIIDVFEENGTAYYVMEYAEGGSLAATIKKSTYLPESVATRYIIQIAEALDYIHQRKMNHLDVKPSNILLNEKNEAVLIDFGLSKQYDGVTGNQTSTTPVGISEGYAPMEQYKQGGVVAFSPETDIYALGATFFKLLTGITPPSASDVNEDGVPVEELKAKGVSPTAIDVICYAMRSRKKERMKEVRVFINALREKSVSLPSVNNLVNTCETVDAEDKTILDDEPRDGRDGHKYDELTHTIVSTEEAEADIQKRLLARNHNEKVNIKTERNNTPNSQRINTKLWIGGILGLLIIVGFFYFFNNQINPSQEGLANDVGKTVNPSSQADTPRPSQKEKKSNTPDVVDMGVSVLWAQWNYGAKSIYDYGTNVHWGVTDINASAYSNLKSFPQNIANTDKDIFHVIYGKEWRLPTRKDFDELRNNCMVYQYTENGVSGCLLVSNINGNKLFFPNYKRKTGEPKNDVFEDDKEPVYWTAECIPSYSGGYVYDFYFAQNDYSYRPSMLFPVRAIRNK